MAHCGSKDTEEKAPGKYSYYYYTFLFVSFCSNVNVVFINLK